MLSVLLKLELLKAFVFTFDFKWTLLRVTFYMRPINAQSINNPYIITWFKFMQFLQVAIRATAFTSSPIIPLPSISYS